jgi:hypothetical protein
MVIPANRVLLNGNTCFNNGLALFQLDSSSVSVIDLRRQYSRSLCSLSVLTYCALCLLKFVFGLFVADFFSKTLFPVKDPVRITHSYFLLHFYYT